MCFLADINECMDPSPCPHGKCVNTPGSYRCVGCADGYQPRNGRCIGKDFRLPLGGTLTLTKSQEHTQHACLAQCPPDLGGGDRPEHPSVPSCPLLCNTDVDECLVERTCAHGQCINLDGSFRCSCYRGYEVAPDGKSCEGTGDLLLLPECCLSGPHACQFPQLSCP